MTETDWIESAIFPVKCAGCHHLYDSIANRECPECKTTSIVSRLEWSRRDFELADMMVAKAKEGH